MNKSSDAFRTIGETARQTGVSARTLRDWETKFTELEPLKRAGGRRYYDPEAIVLIGAIHTLISERGLTVRGVQLLLTERGPKGVIDEVANAPAATPRSSTRQPRAPSKDAAPRRAAAAPTAHLREALARLENAKTGLRRALRQNEP